MEHKKREEEELLRQEPLEEQEEQTEQEEQDGQEESRAGKAAFEWFGAVVTAVVSVVLLFTFVAQQIRVEGPSMQPTLYEGDRLLAVNHSLCDFGAGDVVIVEQFNARLNDRIVKRIIATGGQTVDIDFGSGTVFVDGTALEEPYINERTYTPEGLEFPVTLGENEVFLLGDNRNRSTDSRSTDLGPVDERYIVGKAVLLLVPGPTESTGEIDWSRIGFIR